jgi:triosephosphate isomerase (TIM)
MNTRTPLVAGNWKMHTTVGEAENLVLEMRDRLDRIEGADKVICPPFVSLSAVEVILRATSIKLGAQNMYFEARGAYTGEISPPMLGDLCEFVILGHSERRQYFGDTDEIVNKKVRAALANGLKPILCIGERLDENEAGRTETVLERQTRVALDGIQSSTVRQMAEFRPCSDEKATTHLVIAYEPVWAIGTGRAASGKQAAATIGFVRKVLGTLWDDTIAEQVPILYGGSVTGANIAEFVSHSEIDGALVGGASLKAEEFISIARQTAELKRNAK